MIESREGSCRLKAAADQGTEALAISTAPKMVAVTSHSAGHVPDVMANRDRQELAQPPFHRPKGVSWSACEPEKNAPPSLLTDRKVERRSTELCGLEHQLPHHLDSGTVRKLLSSIRRDMVMKGYIGAEIGELEW